MVATMVNRHVQGSGQAANTASVESASDAGGRAFLSQAQLLTA